jgi:ABC-type sugar transport system ATPase subunit
MWIQGALRRGQIKPDDVAHLVDKQWVGGKLEGLGAMRLKVERLPNAMDGRGRKSDRARHRAPAPMRRMRDGIAYITEDRKVDGFFETMTVDQNIYLGFLSSPRVKRFLYSTREMKRKADEWMASLSISALKRSLKIVEYSGGNQQKVVVGKSLAQEPTVVIFDEPTRGVDVSAIPQIHAAIRNLAREHKAVIVISSYLPEIMAISAVSR